MASSYNISEGTGSVKLSSVKGTCIALQVVGSNDMDADVTVKIQQSMNGDNYGDISGTSKVLSPDGSQIIETCNFILDEARLHIDVGSATVGTLNIFVSSKKKAMDGASVNSVLEKSSIAISSVIPVGSSAVTLLAPNPNRIGYAMYNNGTRDVFIMYKPASEYTENHGYLLHSKDDREFHSVTYTGEISSIRADNNGSQLMDIYIVEW